MKVDKRIMVFGAIVVAVVAIAVAGAVAMSRSEKVDQAAATALAECLAKNGAKLYGAKWCPHCQRQKKAFGSAADKLPYVECADESAPNGQAKECADAGVTGYPTWVFPDGTRQSGEVSLAELAVRSGCPYEAKNIAPAPGEPGLSAPPAEPTNTPPMPANTGF